MGHYSPLHAKKGLTGKGRGQDTGPTHTPLTHGQAMKEPLIPPGEEDLEEIGQEWPKTINEAVSLLLAELGQEVKEEIASLPEGELGILHFGIGADIRNRFGLWTGNKALLLDCQKAKFEGRTDMPHRVAAIHPDDASGMIIQALWARLRH